MNESIFFKFFKTFQDYKNKCISHTEDKILSSKIQTQQIGLFIFNSDKIRCEQIRKNMFEYINNQFKSIFSCDIKFDVNDYQLGENEEFRSNFAIIRWFKKKNTWTETWCMARFSGVHACRVPGCP